MVDFRTVSNPFGGLNVLKNWKAGDTREMTEKDLRRLRASPAYDSYSNTYHMDGLIWRIINQVSRADGQTIITLEASNE